MTTPIDDAALEVVKAWWADKARDAVDGEVHLALLRLSWPDADGNLFDDVQRQITTIIAREVEAALTAARSVIEREAYNVGHAAGTAAARRARRITDEIRSVTR